MADIAVFDVVKHRLDEAFWLVDVRRTRGVEELFRWKGKGSICDLGRHPEKSRYHEKVAALKLKLLKFARVVLSSSDASSWLRHRTFLVGSVLENNQPCYPGLWEF